VNAVLGPRVADVTGQGQLGKLLWSAQLAKRDRSVLRKARTVHVFEQGLVLGDQDDAVADAFRWTDVDELTRDIVEHRVQSSVQVTSYKRRWIDYRFSFKLPDRTVVLSGVTDEGWVSVFEGFSELVSPLVCAAQLPGMMSALRNGETLEFGTLEVALTGLTKPAWLKKNRQRAWADLKGFRVRNGELQISDRTSFTTWYFTPVGRVPNVDALLEILGILFAGR
jgi:hypothetical protein